MSFHTSTQAAAVHRDIVRLPLGTPLSNSTAEQRPAWAIGDKAKFFPYGKTRNQVLGEQD